LVLPPGTRDAVLRTAIKRDQTDCCSSSVGGSQVMQHQRVDPRVNINEAQQGREIGLNLELAGEIWNSAVYFRPRWVYCGRSGARKRNKDN
jgi:hypothetical protein